MDVLQNDGFAGHQKPWYGGFLSKHVEFSDK